MSCKGRRFKTEILEIGTQLMVVARTNQEWRHVCSQTRQIMRHNERRLPSFTSLSGGGGAAQAYQKVASSS